MKIVLLIGWCILVLMVLVFNYGAHHNDTDEPDESSHKGLYKYTHPDNDENVIF